MCFELVWRQSCVADCNGWNCKPGWKLEPSIFREAAKLAVTKHKISSKLCEACAQSFQLKYKSKQAPEHKIWVWYQSIPMCIELELLHYISLGFSFLDAPLSSFHFVLIIAMCVDKSDTYLLDLVLPLLWKWKKHATYWHKSSSAINTKYWNNVKRKISSCFWPKIEKKRQVGWSRLTTNRLFWSERHKVFHSISTDWAVWAKTL